MTSLRIVLCQVDISANYLLLDPFHNILRAELSQAREDALVRGWVIQMAADFAARIES